jgi:hypothetical protein
MVHFRLNQNIRCPRSNIRSSTSATSYITRRHFPAGCADPLALRSIGSARGDLTRPKRGSLMNWRFLEFLAAIQYDIVLALGKSKAPVSRSTSRALFLCQ